uniref:Phospholipase A1 member A n=1 Tax=Scleropages formosus TaxID=113540 RepID=A0A8D0CD08_SCLFO
SVFTSLAPRARGTGLELVLGPATGPSRQNLRANSKRFGGRSSIRCVRACVGACARVWDGPCSSRASLRSDPSLRRLQRTRGRLGAQRGVWTVQHHLVEEGPPDAPAARAVPPVLPQRPRLSQSLPEGGAVAPAPKSPVQRLSAHQDHHPWVQGCGLQAHLGDPPGADAAGCGGGQRAGSGLALPGLLPLPLGGAALQGRGAGGLRAHQRAQGLDPAGPLVNRRDRYDRLDPSDALFVEAIHTDADNFGISIPIGHVSFFPNGGKDQPGCTRSLIPAVFSYVICDHMRAVHLYMSALNGSCPLAGIPCPSYEDFLDGRCLDCRETFDGTCPRIGLQEKSGITIALPPEEEKLYLFTSQAPPYCAKHILLEMEVSPQTRSTEVQVTLRSLGHPDTKQRIKLHTGTSVYKRTFPLPVSLCAVDSIHMQNTATWFNRKEDVRFLSICLSEFPPRREDAPLCVTHVDLWKSTPWSHDFVHLCSDP